MLPFQHNATLRNLAFLGLVMYYLWYFQHIYMATGTCKCLQYYKHSTQSCLICPFYRISTDIHRNSISKGSMTHTAGILPTEPWPLLPSQTFHSSSYEFSFSPSSSSAPASVSLLSSLHLKQIFQAHY